MPLCTIGAPIIYHIPTTNMIIGEFEGRLTDKNRLAIPKKLRDELKEGLILSRGYEGCLLLLDGIRFKQLDKIINKQPILNLSVRDTKRFLLGSSFELELDGQGRFVLPNRLKDYAKLNDEVFFIGLGDWIEIWDKEIWNSKLENLSKEAGDIAEKLITQQSNAKTT